MLTEMVPIDALSFDPNNARTHDDKNLVAIKGSLTRFGQQKPIVVTKDGVVVAGNGTLAAAKALGWKDIEVKQHPTQKPVKLAEWFFERWGKPADLVADLFLGSGSTLIACEKTGRRCFGMEIDPKYCDVVISRWEQFTGKLAVREEVTHGTSATA